MKKVVVALRDMNQMFEGNNLEVINKTADIDMSSNRIVGPELLIIKDGKETIAVFRDWDYWKKLE